MNNSKRKTLGGLSPAQVNARMSLGPVRIAREEKYGRKTLAGRPSILGTRGASGNNATSSKLAPSAAPPRRSSTVSKTPGVKQDPRPSGDKTFQANCIRRLIGYLSTHGYDQPLTPKMLASPIKQDITNIYHFLMHQVDPNLNPKTLGKLEDDVPVLYKRLRYPFQMSKSVLFAVGSPHTWPGVLAALAWLTELLLYQEKTQQVRETMFDDRQHTEDDFFAFVAESYSCFLAGDDAACQAVDERVGGEFVEQQEAAQALAQTLQQEKEQLEKQAEELQQGPTPLEAAQMKTAELKGDKEKFIEHIAGLEARKHKMHRRMQEQLGDQASLREQLAACLKENEAVRQTVSEQVYNHSDVQRMKNERAKLEEMLAGVAASREAHERGAAEQELRCERQLNDLEGSLQVYLSAADRLQLIPSTAKRANNMQFEAQLNRNASSYADLVNVDLKAVKLSLVHIKDATAARCRELGEEEFALRDRLDASRHSLTERAEESAALATQVGAQDRALMASKDALERQLAQAGSEADAVRRQVAQLQAEGSIDPADSQQAILTLQAKHRDTCNSNAQELRQLKQDLHTAMDMLRTHRQGINASLDATLAHVRAVHSELVEV